MIDARLSAAGRWLRADLRRFDVVVAVVVVAVSMLLVLGSPDGFDTGWPEWAAGVGAFCLLIMRRWQPAVLLAVALVLTAVHVGMLERPTPMIFTVLVLLATTCVRLERWPAIGLGAGIAVSLYVMGLVGTDAEYGDARAVIGIAWTSAAVGTADAVRSWRRYRESATEQIRSAVLAAEAQARQQVSEERLTIARELHDLLAHNLSVMNVQTGAALHLLSTDPAQAETSLRTARDAGRSVLDELSELLVVLRTGEAGSGDGSAGDGIGGDGSEGRAPTSSLPTVDEVPDLVDTMRSAGLAVAWNRSGEPRPLAPAVSLAAYRIVQEALTNAAKHGSGSVELSTRWSDDGLSIIASNERASNDTASNDTASNQRVGASAGGAGLGLVGMRERASTNGGRLAVDDAGGRFTIDAWLPTASAHAEPADR